MLDLHHPMAAHLKILDREEARVECVPRRSKVCLVGYAEMSRDLAWYDDPDTEVWGVNCLYRFLPRADRWFQVHANWRDQALWPENTDMGRWLAEAQMPVYMAQVEADIPTSVRYPLARVAGDGPRYFTSSIAYMLALALAEGFEHIGLYGIELLAGGEYFFEKPCVEYWLGRAIERGVQVHLPAGCALLHQSHLYGYELAPDAGFYSLARLRARLTFAQARRETAREQVWLLRGRAVEAEAVAQPERLEQLRMQAEEALQTYYRWDGACAELAHLADVLELRQRGGTVA